MSDITDTDRRTGTATHIFGEAGLRFRKHPLGWIIDGLTGACIATVNVHFLDTGTADRVSNTIIAALHQEFGPAEEGGAA